MTLEEIAEKAIPFAKKECEIGKGLKLKARKQLIERVREWHQAQLKSLEIDYGVKLVKGDPDRTI